MGDSLIIKAGWGYWDTTAYPIGGCFRRAPGPLYVVVKEVMERPYKGADYLVRFDRPTMQSGTAAVGADALDVRPLARKGGDNDATR